MNDVEEKKFADVIATAYGRLPDPELTRLKAVEDRLIRALPRQRSEKSASSWLGWLIFGLATSAVAGWWVSELFVGDPKQDSTPPAVIERQDAKPEQGNKNGIGTQSPNESKNSPTIYRREAY
jgi:hypothetical protein